MYGNDWHRRRSLFVTPKRPKLPKKKYVRHILKTAFRRTLMFFGAVFLFSMLAGIVGGLMAESGPVTLPKKFVLAMAMDYPLVEHENMAGPRTFSGDFYVMRDVVDALDHARGDKRVKGLVVRMNGAGIDLAHMQELRSAIARFRESGKFAYIFDTSFGSGGTGLGTYYFASVFDEIWMQPMGTLTVAGINLEIPYGRAVLDRIGIEPQFFARKEYKSVFDGFTESTMPPQEREMMTSLLGDIAAQMQEGIARDRKMTPAVVRTMIDKGLYMDQDALKRGFVTRLGDSSDLDRKVSMDLTGKPDSDKVYTGMTSYIAVMRREEGEKALMAGNPSVALVNIEGAIMSTEEMSHAATLFYDDTLVPADEVAGILDDITDDPDTKIIVLRIDSPGGSPVASEAVRLAILRAQKAGKKVIVSMGGMTASGGYWIAAPADRIFALPATITGSIGVAGGKFALAGLWDKVGLNWDSVRFGKNAGIWSPHDPFDANGAALMNEMMDSVYDGFVARVAEGRKMTKEQVDKVARGRVWTGRQALERGLVDELGGLDVALDYAARQLGAKDRTGIDVYVYPETESLIDQIRDQIGIQVRAEENVTAMARPVIEAWGRAFLASKYMTYLPMELTSP